jgi:predicted metalloprotease with PDZ domain
VKASLHYLVTIENPANHYVQVRLSIKEDCSALNSLEFFLPSWSPGSYLMREYAKYMQELKVSTPTGEPISIKQTKKSTWQISSAALAGLKNGFDLEYKVYCREVSLRTCFMHASQAFLHGPAYLVGIKNFLANVHTIEFRRPLEWSTISTGLNCISQEALIYEAQNYDTLVDCPVQMGCFKQDYFQAAGKNHFIAWVGSYWKMPEKITSHMHTIVETIASSMGGVPYEHYTFIVHSMLNSYGGLEHANSTALIFDTRKWGSRKDYIQWLGLVSHEYFHTWNVKRLRPVELGPFNYEEENYTSMLWLAEGLTSFMDNYYLLKSTLISPQEYLDLVLADFNNYYKHSGRKFETLEESSWNAWIKYYRPHENSSNTTISYYIKGGLAFFMLHLWLKQMSKSVEGLTQALWQFAKKRPELGITKEEFFQLLTSYSSAEVAEKFDVLISTTEDLRPMNELKSMGVDVVWETKTPLQLGAEVEYSSERVFIKQVMQGGAAYASGLNVGDEIIAVNGMRITKGEWSWFLEELKEEESYDVLLCRMGQMLRLSLQAKRALPLMKQWSIVHEQQFARFTT